MKITKSQLKQIINEEFGNSEVQAELDFGAAINSLWKHGYSRDDIMSLADDLDGAKEMSANDGREA